MPKIPRTDPAIGLQMANQPTMNPDALTGPGRALQQLGRAIGGLQGAFDAMSQPGDQDVLSAQLAAMDASDQSAKYYTERLASFTPETDPDTWHQETTKGITAIWDDASTRVPAYPKLQQGFAVNRHRFTGNYDVRAHQYATGVKTERFATGALETMARGLAGIDPTTDEGRRSLDTIDAQLGRIPGINIEKAREGLANGVLKEIEAEAQKDPFRALQKIEALKKWQSEFKTRQQGVGPQSNLEMQDFTRGRNFAALPAGNVRNIVLHDVSGPTGSRRLPSGGHIPHYHITFDDKGIYNEISLDQRAPHAAAFNKNSIGIAHIGYEGDKLSPQAIANGAKAVKMVADRFGISPEHILTHPGAGPSATKSGGKDPNEASWRGQVLAYIDRNMGGVGNVATSSTGINVDLTAYSPQGGGSKMEGGYAASRKGPDGNAQVRTLADVAAGRSQYVTVAGNPRDYNKTFTIPRISFVDAGGKTQTLDNVKAVVHDTGRAFVDAPEGRFDIAIDRDATDQQMAASHAMWKKDGVQFIPQDRNEKGTQVAERGLTQYAGVPKPTQVADASGRIGAVSGADISGRIAGRIDNADTVAQPPDARAPNTIPGQHVAQGGVSPQEFIRQQQDAQARATPGRVRQHNEVWDQPSIRTHILDKIDKISQQLGKQADTLLNSYIDRAEKSAGDGYFLPDDERSLIHDRVEKYGTPEMKARLTAAEQAASITSSLKGLTPIELSARAAQFRAAMNTAGATPDTIAKAKAVESLHSRMVSQLGSNAVGWATEAGVIPPQPPITPETFSAGLLAMRKQAADVISQHYGKEYRQFFSDDERKALEAQFNAGGEPMLAMMATMYDALGDDMPRAVAEIAPKAPEAVRAGYLIATHGDPQAAKDIAATIARRKDPNYTGHPKMDDAAVGAKETDYFSDLYKTVPKVERDATVRAARAIYEARVEDPSVFDEELYRTALGEAMGERMRGEIKYGGIVQTKRGMFGGGDGAAIVLPSIVRQDTWKDLFNEITIDDLRKSNHPLPVDRNGNLVSMPKLLGGRLVSTGDGKYLVELTNDAGQKGWVMEARAPAGSAHSDAAAEMAPKTPFVFDILRLAPELRKRYPGLIE